MYAIVIDKQGFKVEFVRLLENGTIDSYVLKDGESVIANGWEIANSMNKPQYTSNGWIDTEPLPPVEPEPQPPNEIQLLSAELSDIEIKLMKLERGII